MNKTKIVATIGPSNCSYEKLKELVKAGMNVARLNLNHADYDFCTEVVENINKINDELNTSIATMFDIRSENIKLGDTRKAKLQYINMLEKLCIDYNVALAPGIATTIKKVRNQQH